MAERELALYSAKIAEQSERYQDMVEEMKKVAVLANEQELSVEERNLLSVSYKNLVGSRRASWRILQSIEQSESAKGNEKRVAMIKKYRAVVEGELDKICHEILVRSRGSDQGPGSPARGFGESKGLKFCD